MASAASAVLRLLARGEVQVVDGHVDRFLVDGEVLLDRAAKHKALPLVHEAVDGDAGLLARGNRVYRKARAGDDVRRPRRCRPRSVCRVTGSTSTVPVLPAAHGGSLQHVAEVDALAERGDDAVRGQPPRFRPWGRCSGGRSRRSPAELHELQPDAGNGSFAGYFGGESEVFDFTPSASASAISSSGGGHLGPRAAVNHRHFLRAQAQSGPCNVHSRVAAAYYRHSPAHLGPVFAVDGLKEADAVPHSGLGPRRARRA